jgi:hypothetical protein
MNIAVYDPFSFYAGVNDYRNFIVATLLSIANHRQGDKFFLLAKQPGRFG